jgi:hypothetical protein
LSIFRYYSPADLLLIASYFLFLDVKKNHMQNVLRVNDRLCKVKNGSAYLSNTEVDNEWRVLWIRQRTAGSVVATEVGSTVDDDTLNGHAEATVQANDTVGLQCLLDTVNQAIVLTICSSLADISTQASTGVIQWVDEAEGGGSSSTTGSQVSDEVAPELCLLVNTAQEDLFVDVLEGEVEGLGREVSDDVGQVTTPEGAEALFLWNTDEAIDDACTIK